jgi:hypothetical protein
MNLAVDFNNQSNTMAIKIYDKLTDFMLSPEFQSQNIFIPENIPQYLFRWSGIISEFIGEFLFIIF